MTDDEITEALNRANKRDDAFIRAWLREHTIDEAHEHYRKMEEDLLALMDAYKRNIAVQSYEVRGTWLCDMVKAQTTPETDEP
jgi:hypothetical protein